MNIVVYCGSTPGRIPVYTQAAAELGARIAAGGHTLVYGGGSAGMMGAVADAALAGGARVIGVIPEFMFKWDLAHTGVSEMIVTKDMHERKRRMFELGDVFVALPGGTGTLEEISEAVSWMGLGLITGSCCFANINGFYDNIESFFQTMDTEGYMRADKEGRVVFVRSIDELFQKNNV